MAVVQKLISRFMNINQIQRHALLSFGSLLVITGLGYVATFYFAHILGPAVMGAYFLFLAYYGIFDLIGDGGFGGAAVKRISEGKEQNEFFTAFFILRIALLIVSIAVFIAISPYLTGLDHDGLLYWLIIALVAGTVASITGTNLYGTTQVGIMQVSNLFNTIVKNLFQIAAVFIGFSVGGMVAGFIAGMVTATIVNFRFIRLTLTRCNRSHFSRLFSFSFWTFLSSGGLLIFGYADTILIGYFMTETDIGIYRVAYQLASVGSFIVIAFHTVLYPQISSWHTRHELGSIESALKRAFTYSLFLAIPVTAGGIILSGKLLSFLYGESFVPGATVLVILLLMQIVNVFTFLQTTCLNAMDMPRASFYISALAAILNIILNILLIPPFGILGSAVASLATMLLNAVLAFGMLRSHIHVRLDGKSVINLVLSAGIMSAVILVVTSFIAITAFVSLVFVVSLGAVVYFLTVFALDEEIRTDLKGLWNTMNISSVV